MSRTLLVDGRAGSPARGSADRSAETNARSFVWVAYQLRPGA